eukprot:TRINITY_DN3727_c0_g1_i2.p1 TRINITY_DN3727_c0_g1~~TRINITY_DN3727_c0_g1_i2.p1  ORF type:complete len:1148 (+),score=174.79 TRINITY_DN3727_c0_g1_i2:178-3444(+)
MAQDEPGQEFGEEDLAEAHPEEPCELDDTLQTIDDPEECDAYAEGAEEHFVAGGDYEEIGNEDEDARFYEAADEEPVDYADLQEEAEDLQDADDYDAEQAAEELEETETAEAEASQEVGQTEPAVVHDQALDVGVDDLLAQVESAPAAATRESGSREDDASEMPSTIANASSTAIDSDVTEDSFQPQDEFLVLQRAQAEPVLEERTEDTAVPAVPEQPPGRRRNGFSRNKPMPEGAEQDTFSFVYPLSSILNWAETVTCHQDGSKAIAFLCGAPGAGKSYFTKALQAAFGEERVSVLSNDMQPGLYFVRDHSVVFTPADNPAGRFDFGLFQRLALGPLIRQYRQTLTSPTSLIIFDDTNTVVRDWVTKVRIAIEAGIPLRNIAWFVADQRLQTNEEVRFLVGRQDLRQQSFWAAVESGQSPHPSDGKYVNAKAISKFVNRLRATYFDGNGALQRWSEEWLRRQVKDEVAEPVEEAGPEAPHQEVVISERISGIILMSPRIVAGRAQDAPASSAATQNTAAVEQATAPPTPPRIWGGRITSRVSPAPPEPKTPPRGVHFVIEPQALSRALSGMTIDQRASFRRTLSSPAGPVRELSTPTPRLDQRLPAPPATTSELFHPERDTVSAAPRRASAPAEARSPFQRAVSAPVPPTKPLPRYAAAPADVQKRPASGKPLRVRPGFLPRVALLSNAKEPPLAHARAHVVHPSPLPVSINIVDLGLLLTWPSPYSRRWDARSLSMLLQPLADGGLGWFEGTDCMEMILKHHKLVLPERVQVALMRCQLSALVIVCDWDEPAPWPSPFGDPNPVDMERCVESLLSIYGISAAEIITRQSKGAPSEPDTNAFFEWSVKRVMRAYPGVPVRVFHRDTLFPLISPLSPSRVKEVLTAAPAPLPYCFPDDVEMAIVTRLIERRVRWELAAQREVARLNLRYDVSYSGVVLSARSHTVLVGKCQEIVPEGWEWIAHHMTICLGSLANAPPGTAHTVGADVYLVVTAVGVSDQAIAVAVEGYPTINSIPHITVAIPQGGQPVNSNKITDWAELDASQRFRLKGCVQECARCRIDVERPNHNPPGGRGRGRGRYGGRRYAADY